ncbi:hypothetical protein GCM10010412_097840 [Nonomuraea recticatena]|uniref:Helix-turn-helix domain-containing protein n=1 Tax=Nonomuraea recticatena TaxID=46178 RepID=A0ABP6FU17_9ACTN
MLVLVCLRKGETFAEIAAGLGIGTATAWRYVHEASPCSPAAHPAWIKPYAPPSERDTPSWCWTARSYPSTGWPLTGPSVESARSAVLVLPPVRFSVPLTEPGVRLSPHRALHGSCR